MVLFSKQNISTYLIKSEINKNTNSLHFSFYRTAISCSNKIFLQNIILHNCLNLHFFFFFFCGCHHICNALWEIDTFVFSFRVYFEWVTYETERYVGKGTVTVWKFDSAVTGLSFMLHVMQYMSVYWHTFQNIGRSSCKVFVFWHYDFSCLADTRPGK